MMPPARVPIARALLVAGFAGLVGACIPAVFVHGRFWAEEGVVYFANAWPAAVFAVHTGYLNLAAGTATLLAARLVPLEAAPLVSSAVGLAIQACPAPLLATSGIDWLCHPAPLGVALLLLLGARSYFAVPAQFARGPDWRAQVAAWRADSGKPLLVWPTGFTPGLLLLPPGPGGLTTRR